MPTAPATKREITPPPANWINQAPMLVWSTDLELRFTALSGSLITPLGLEPTAAIGTSLVEYMASDNATFPSIDSHRAAAAGESVGYLQQFFEQFYQVHVSPLRDASGKIVGVVGAAINITPLHQEKRELHAAHDSRTAELAAVNTRLQQDIARRQEMERELRDSEERFRSIAESIALPVVITRVDDGTILYANRRINDDYPEGGTIVGRKSTDFLQNPADRTRIYEIMKRDGRVRDMEVHSRKPDGNEAWVSLCMDPITYQGQPATLTSFLDITARHEAEEALRNERNLLIRLLELNQRDRQLIAYEIHDGFVQDITAASMFLEAAIGHLPADNADAQHSATQAAKLLRGAIDEARRLIDGLFPEVLSEAGVIPAVESLVGELRDQAGIEVEFVHEGELQRLAPALEMAIYRIVQESLSNVRQHSGSRKARVEMIRAGSQLDLLIRDWGKGFNPKKVSAKRYGLTGIRERAKLLGGHAEITGDDGTMVKVRLPLVDVMAVEK